MALEPPGHIRHVLPGCQSRSNHRSVVGRCILPGCLVERCTLPGYLAERCNLLDYLVAPGNYIPGCLVEGRYSCSVAVGALRRSGMNQNHLLAVGRCSCLLRC